ncbi:MAG: Glu-tRNA(Gln) amidotransferase subunit GatE, partial [Candidatus Bathyarchaeota archaeon]
EIKGVQELELVSKIIEDEVQRQLSLLKIRADLKKRKAKAESIKDNFIDVTPIFKHTKCKVLQEAINQKKQVLAVKLPEFAGLLTRELAPGMRLGSEMADIARFWGRVGGIFHTDELPAYGIVAEEVDRLRQLTSTGEQDAVVFVADTLENATDALKAVTRRAREALKGVPEETRAANPDGTTRHMRPRPGAARMYPETDVPPIQLSEEYLEKLRTNLPEMPEEKMGRLVKQYELNRKLAKQVLNSEYTRLFEDVIRNTRVSPTIVAVALTETLKALRRNGVPIENVGDQHLKGLFGAINSGDTTKEAIPDILTWLSKHEGATVREAIEELGLKMLSEKDLLSIIDGLMSENRALVEKRGMSAFGVFMGLVMEKVRGRARAELVSEVLKKCLSRAAG